MIILPHSPFPQEMFNHILSFLEGDPETLKQCGLASPHLLESSRMYRFRSVRLGHVGSRSVYEDSSLFCNLTQQRSFANYVRHLEIDFCKSRLRIIKKVPTPVSLAEIVKITASLPLLRSLRLTFVEILDNSIPPTPLDHLAIDSLCLEHCGKINQSIPALLHLFRPRKLSVYGDVYSSAEEGHPMIKQPDKAGDYPLHVLDLCGRLNPDTICVLKSTISPETVTQIHFWTDFLRPGSSSDLSTELDLFLYVRDSLQHLELGPFVDIVTVAGLPYAEALWSPLSSLNLISLVVKSPKQVLTVANGWPEVVRLLNATPKSIEDIRLHINFMHQDQSIMPTDAIRPALERLHKLCRITFIWGDHLLRWGLDVRAHVEHVNAVLRGLKPGLVEHEISMYRRFHKSRYDSDSEPE